VLHEHVPDINPNEAILTVSSGRADPVAIEQDGEVLMAPDLKEPALDQPPMLADPGDGELGEQPGQRSPSFTPDRITDLEGQLDYYETFTPIIAPFKRVTSLDATALGPAGARMPVLVIADGRLRPVAIEGADSAPPDARPRDRFWGEASLDFSRGRTLPLPSVSPESRILSLKTEPEIMLSVARDGADNFFIALDRNERVPSEPVRIAYLTDAPTSYFGGDIPALGLETLARFAPPLDAELKRRGRALARELGVQEGANLKTALHVLTEHFRAFEESSEPPTDTGDIYSDLVRGKKGVCRHRAYGFVVTAHALGIPARFVQNEAHSFVEVRLPGALGFRRIDLGGAAQGLNAHADKDAPVYQAKLPDTLPRPAAYEESYSQLGLGTSGVTQPADEQLEGRWLPPAEDDPNSAVSSAAAPRPLTGNAHDANAGSPTDGVAPPKPRAPLAITLDALRTRVLRGQRLELSGRITRASAVEGVAGLRVEVSFAAEDRRDRLLLGIAVTDATGAFSGSFGVPTDLELGDYRLVVLTPGDAEHAAAMAE
jgi:transglutaminase-like putative cysteine protease